MKITSAVFLQSCRDIGGKPSLKAPEFAFIGRSNVGKSSLINMLCSKKGLAHTSATPGKTKLINYFIVNNKWYIVDLPGYGFARISKSGQTQLKKMIEEYVGRSMELRTLFVLLDSRIDFQEIDRNFISAAAGAGVDMAIVLTKCDKLSASRAATRAATLHGQIKEIAGDIPVFVSSAEKGTGKDGILEFIERKLNETNKQ